MRTQHMRKYKLFCGVALCAMTINAIAPIAAAAAAAGESGSNDGKTTTPIKHVIVIIGENRTFDHLFATYVPNPRTGADPYKPTNGPAIGDLTDLFNFQ